MDNLVVGVVSREVFLPSSCALVIELFIVALISVLSFFEPLHHFASIAQLYRRSLYRLTCLIFFSRKQI